MLLIASEHGSTGGAISPSWAGNAKATLDSEAKLERC